jgi:hypothetical protein
LDTRTSASDYRGLFSALEKAYEFPNSPQVIRQGEKIITLGQAVALLEALTVYIEQITGISDDLSPYRNADFKVALDVLKTASATSPVPNRHEYHFFNDQKVIVDDIRLWAFMEELKAFMESKVPKTGDEVPASVRSEIMIRVPDDSDEQGTYGPQSMLPDGVELGDATRGLIMTALHKPRGK